MAKTRAHRSDRQRAAFTLIEMMVVVSILAVLASAAFPQLITYVHRSRRAEALYGLRTIHDAQTVYYANEKEYSDSFEILGKPLEAGTLTTEDTFQGRVYTFSLDTWDLAGHPNANFRATATANLDPSDDTLDIIIIENRITVMD